MGCTHFLGLLQATGLPLQRFRWMLPENHPPVHIHITRSQAQDGISNKKLGQIKVLGPFPSKLSLAHSPPHSQANTCTKSTFQCKAPWFIFPWENPYLLVKPNREERELTVSSGPVTAASTWEGKLAAQRRPCISSWPEMLLRSVSVFMKCFSNKVSVLHRVGALIKCRTCAVCQLAAEAYLNAFLDTIVLRLIFSPWVFLILLVLFFLRHVSFSAYLYPPKGMSGICFHQWFLRAWCRLPYCSSISPAIPSSLNLAWWPLPCQSFGGKQQPRLNSILFWAILVMRTFCLLYSSLFLAHSRHSINSSFKHLHPSYSPRCGSTFLETAIS